MQPPWFILITVFYKSDYLDELKEILYAKRILLTPHIALYKKVSFKLSLLSDVWSVSQVYFSFPFSFLWDFFQTIHWLANIALKPECVQEIH